IPGLARRARQSLDVAIEALEKFLAPDPYSRTKEYEGRRIEVVDGGWRLLNHDKYSEALSLEDRRAKDAERQKRRRERLKRLQPVLPSDSHVTSRDASAESRHLDPEADPNLGEEEAPPARVRTIPPSTEPTPVPGTAPTTEPDLIPQLQATVQQLADDGPAIAARKQLGDDAWARLNALRWKLSGELMVTCQALHPMDRGRTLLAMRIRDCRSIELATQRIDHVLAVLEAEARTQKTVRWLYGSVFEERNWERALAMTVDDAKRTRGGPKNGPRETPPSPPTRKLKSLG
ncbi:MAG TPA: hypothetical protein VGM39_08600, partial [Kofleriaceae bacterium]